MHDYLRSWRRHNHLYRLGPTLPGHGAQREQRPYPLKPSDSATQLRSACRDPRTSSRPTSAAHENQEPIFHSGHLCFLFFSGRQGTHHLAETQRCPASSCGIGEVTP
jgi:hypothetical protein